MPVAANAAPSVADALKLTPVQRGIEYDTPEGDEVAKCSIKAEKIGNVTAWVVRGPDNEVLRQFADSNADNVVDIWSYFRDGLEVYRDVDSNNNGKADQYRWFHSNGIRWAIDTNEDNAIDAWKLISPEEVAEEAINALATKDAKRFERLLITAEDITRYGYRTLADILHGVRGLYVSDDRNFSSLGARGFGKPGDYNSRILLLVNGHRVNDNVFGQAEIGAEFGLDPATDARLSMGGEDPLGGAPPASAPRDDGLSEPDRGADWMTRYAPPPTGA